MPRICCVADHAYPAVEPRAAGGFGGTETRAWEFARGLARLADCEVSLAVRTPAPLLRGQYEGVRLLRRPGGRLAKWRIEVAADVRRSRRFPGIEVVRPRPGLLWQLPLVGALRVLRGRGRVPPPPERFFRRIDADAFCCFGVYNSAAAIATAAATGRKSVLMLGADSDLVPRFAGDPDYVSPYGERADGFRYALTEADAVVAQTERQRDLLRERFGRESVVIGNPIDVAGWSAAATAEPPPAVAGLGRYALWVGRADEFHKRPLLAVEVARRCPDVPFVMVLNPRDVEIERRVRAAAPANVTIVSRVPFDAMPAVFGRAGAFVSTSAAAYEGFPNVFLQAAVAGVPVASLETAPEFVRASGGRFADGELDALAGFVRDLFADEPGRRAAGDRGREYVAEHHDLPAAARRLADVIAGVDNRGVPPPGSAG